MDTSLDTSKQSRPWLHSYPETIAWDAAIDTTPVHEQILATCAREPNRLALDFLGGKTSFASLAEQIRAFAGALQKEFGVTKGTRVALMLPNTPFYPIAYYGTLLAGGTVVNCNPLYTIPELTHITRNAGADIMVTLNLANICEKGQALVEAGHIKKLIVAHFPNALPLVKKILFSVVKAKELTKIPRSNEGAALFSFEALLAKRHTPTPVQINGSDIAVQQYTGGTTGIPKGALLTHANISANADQARLWFSPVFKTGNKAVAVLPFFHIFAMTTCLNMPLICGMSVFMMPRFEPKGFLALLKRAKPDLMPAVPTLIAALVNNSSFTRENLASLELIVSGGAPLPNELRGLFAQKSSGRLVEGYGLTEASPVVCCGPFSGVNKPMSIGLPLPATDVRFVNIDTKQVVGLGEDGELQLKGPQVMAGYFNNDEANADVFMDGWLRTGDVGHMDEDGYVFLVDRIKDLIICSGFNVYPRTIEEALATHEAVEEVNVIGVPDEYRGEAPVAFIKLREGMSTDGPALKTFLAEKINKLEMPKEFIFKDSLPKTLIGKLSKKELREEYTQRKAQK
ncbi:long-chain fatty acid--CoA ligase [Devosia sp. WQ 349]|uniref:long-chain-fatty-acid--CoA ligase n=1 Tax=Devosia sp. WQ 349K1 TaxID=2800329 RepID=UPI0019075388|nr:long-chain fatty acid--CoA ligase [Devosia sp. WQ 349K1]MBK1794881.1 long-chain fatty acid--CoA ligase [Devosia sp. WQ 349K1]